MLPKNKNFVNALHCFQQYALVHFFSELKDQLLCIENLSATQPTMQGLLYKQDANTKCMHVCP